MSEKINSTSEELVVPGTGEVVSLENEIACIEALGSLRVFESQLREAKAVLTAAIIERSKILGTKTIHLPAGGKAEIRDGSEVEWDIETLEGELRDLGLPEDRISSLIKETVVRSVDGRVAKSVAAANEQYAACIESAKTIVQKPSYVSVQGNR